jgi:negative regulator of sigma E activity
MEGQNQELVKQGEEISNLITKLTNLPIRYKVSLFDNAISIV